MLLRGAVVGRLLGFRLRFFGVWLAWWGGGWGGLVFVWVFLVGRRFDVFVLLWVLFYLFGAFQSVVLMKIDRKDYH